MILILLKSKLSSLHGLCNYVLHKVQQNSKWPIKRKILYEQRTYVITDIENFKDKEKTTHESVYNNTWIIFSVITL